MLNQIHSVTIEQNPRQSRFMILNILSVTALAILEIWVAIPLGFVLGLHPMVIAITNVAGATTGVIIIVFASERLRNWILKHHESKKDNGKPGTMQKIWQKIRSHRFGTTLPFSYRSPARRRNRRCFTSSHR